MNTKLNANFFWPEDLHRRLETAAKENLRTLTGEIRYRLKESLEREDKVTEGKEAA